ncbi:unnamed protein product [Dibothriocephalus latus]|uniref:Uncharacterized protein n=1 Tax=Dibothriocephalus latus TaxID=60516 RepID=A0A3P6SV30_DIBLA|nr:unnamed protein product [Dibothriocephalus latus]
MDIPSGRNRKSVTFDSNETKSDDDSRTNRTKKKDTRNKSIRRRVGYVEPKESTTSNLTASNKVNAYKLPKACRAVQRRSILATMRELDYDNPGLLDAYLEWRQEQSAQQEEFWRKSSWKIRKHKKAKDSVDETPDKEMTFEASEKHCW